MTGDDRRFYAPAPIVVQRDGQKCSEKMDKKSRCNLTQRCRPEIKSFAGSRLSAGFRPELFAVFFVIT
jgi:hypothetical protein